MSDQDSTRRELFPNIGGSVGKSIQKRMYDAQGGVKLQMVYPSDKETKHFTYKGQAGHIEAHLANFGHFQLGTSITAPVYRPHHSTTACEPMDEEAQADAVEHNLVYNGFVLVETGDCSYETKARNVQHMGG